MKPYITLFVGALVGSVSYWIQTFLIQPILKYREIKQAIASDLIFFRNVYLPKWDELIIEDSVKKMFQQKESACRRHSGDLKGCQMFLPKCYKWWLKNTKEYPFDAQGELILLANSTKKDDIDSSIKKICKLLKIPEV